MGVKSPGVPSGLANARYPGRTKLAKALPPGLIRWANAPYLHGLGGGGWALMELTNTCIELAENAGPKQSRRLPRDELLLFPKQRWLFSEVAHLPANSRKQSLHLDLQKLSIIRSCAVVCSPGKDLVNAIPFCHCH